MRRLHCGQRDQSAEIRNAAPCSLAAARRSTHTVKELDRLASAEQTTLGSVARPADLIAARPAPGGVKMTDRILIAEPDGQQAESQSTSEMRSSNHIVGQGGRQLSW